MKKFNMDDTFETIWGGLFGMIAIIATIAELILSGVKAAGIAGAVKDIAGTIVVVMVFLVAVNQLKPKKQKGFEAVFESEMTKIIKKYNPVIKKYELAEPTKEGMIRYDIASKLDCISGKESGAYNLLFRVKRGISSITFSVKKTVFGDRKDAVASRIAAKLEINHNKIIDEIKIVNDGFELDFKHNLETDGDARELVDIIDYALLLYIAEYNGK